MIDPSNHQLRGSGARGKGRVDLVIPVSWGRGSLAGTATVSWSSFGRIKVIAETPRPLMAPSLTMRGRTLWLMRYVVKAANEQA